MRVKCVICDKIESLPDDSPEAKRLRNRPIHTHMCQSCYTRIEEKTKERVNTGDFVFRKPHRKENDW